MPTQCSCGATPPENARFCHRCGKPQFEEDSALAEPEALPPVPTAVAPAIPAESYTQISFSNVLALRTALLVASVSTMLESAIGPYRLIGPLIAGFGATFLYAQRAMRVLPMASALKIGWMTALFNALMFTVVAALSFALDGNQVTEMLVQIKKQPGGDQLVQQLNGPFALGSYVLLVWLLLVIASTLLHLAGAALASALARQRQRS